MIVSLSSHIPAVISTTSWVRCLSCQHVIHGHAMWSIRKSAQLHEGVCQSIGYQLDPMLTEIRRAS